MWTRKWRKKYKLHNYWRKRKLISQRTISILSSKKLISISFKIKQNMTVLIAIIILLIKTQINLNMVTQINYFVWINFLFKSTVAHSINEEKLKPMLSTEHQIYVLLQTEFWWVPIQKDNCRSFSFLSHPFHNYSLTSVPNLKSQTLLFTSYFQLETLSSSHNAIVGYL